MKHGSRGPGPCPVRSTTGPLRFLWSSDGLIALNLNAAYGDLAFLGKADAGGQATLTPEVQTGPG